MPRVVLLAVIILVLAGFAMGYNHPAQCTFSIGGLQGQLISESSQDTGSEPSPPPEGCYSTVFVQGTDIMPRAFTFDNWENDLVSTNVTGGGTAYKQGEAWRKIDGTGIWYFEHQVQQNWRAWASAYCWYTSPHSVSAHGWAKAFIRDDRSGQNDFRIKERTGNQGEYGENFQLKTANSPDLFDFGEGGWLNLCGTTIAQALGIFSGRAEAFGDAQALGNLDFVISNIIDNG